MTKYDLMSNEELDSLVAAALDLVVIKSSFGTRYYRAEGCYDYAGPVERFHPTTSWEQAGVLIQDHGIELNYDGIAWEASCNLRGIGRYSDWKNYPEEPCRLAMIVLLMIYEGYRS